MDVYLATEEAYKRGYVDGKCDAMKHGRWVNDNDPLYHPYSYHCSVCFASALTKEGTMYDYVNSKYCPNCGARMDLEDINNESSSD